jgi:protein TonB
MKILVLILLSTLLITSCSKEVKLNNAQTKPLDRASPKYPIQASRDRIEGFVKLSFDINENGETANIKVIDASPEKTFDKQATLAVSKWKYEPLITDGNPVVQKMISVQLDFKLTD